MNYRLVINEQLFVQAIAQADYYQERFSSGALDFEAALDDTYDLIEYAPYSGKRVEGKPESIRIMAMRSKRGAKRYAKRFPFSLVYRIDDTTKTCYIYQLWPQRSNSQIQDPPS